jgi:hypothetical protein
MRRLQAGFFIPAGKFITAKYTGATGNFAAGYEYSST